MPYGLGERICPGKELADMEMFLILANILASYTLQVAPGDTKEMGTQVTSFTVRPTEKWSGAVLTYRCQWTI